jgi:diadenosine tetraphosphatase ApaH/serine/threonine PP2A family protein phosphatase
VTVAILSDIHGNLEALEAVLRDVAVARPDRIVCLGDFVGYGASPNECIARLRPMLEHAVAGNHDLAACGRLKLGYFNDAAAEAARWTDVSLTPEHREYLRALPFEARLPGALLVHASPAEPASWQYVLSPQDAAVEMAAYAEPLCFIGHSHYPGLFENDGRTVRYTREADVEIRPGRKYLVNVASVGQPRDGDPRAGWMLWDAGARRLRHRRLGYDIGAAGRRILEAGLPRFLADRLEWGE